MRILVYNPDKLALLESPDTALELQEVTLPALLSAAQFLAENDKLPLMIAAREALDMQLLRKIRDLGFNGPLFAATAKLQPAYRIDWRYAGADDVVKLPLSGAELRARVAVIERRLHGLSSEKLQIGPLDFYLDGRNPEIKGEPLPLSPREYNILRQLALNSGRVVAKSSIYNALYALAPDQPFDKIIDVYICRLRAKISKAAEGANYIETVSGRGYRLKVPVAA